MSLPSWTSRADLTYRSRLAFMMFSLLPKALLHHARKLKFQLATRQPSKED